MDQPTASRAGSFGLLAGPPAHAGAACELPVLFRVADVSVASASPPAKAAARSQSETPIRPVASTLPQAASAAPPSPVASIQPGPGSAAPAATDPPPPAVATAALAPPASPQPQQTSETIAAAMPTAPQPDALTQALTESAPASAEPLPTTPAERRRLRDQQAAAGDDWFATHGKVIGICFLVALAATMIAARYRTPARVQPADNVVADAPPVQMPGDPAESQATATQPAVALAPPTADITPPADKASTQGPLFPWAGDEPRTALRSDAPSLAPATATASPAAPADETPPELNAPAEAAPPAAPGAELPEQPSYPVTGYGDTFQLAPAPSGSLSTPAPSGIRNERTGSGLY